MERDVVRNHGGVFLCSKARSKYEVPSMNALHLDPAHLGLFVSFIKTGPIFPRVYVGCPRNGWSNFGSILYLSWTWELAHGCVRKGLL